MGNIIESIISYLLSPETIPSPFVEIISILKIIFLVISIILFFMIVAILLKTQWLPRRFFEDAAEFIRFRPHEINKFLKDWKKIIKKQESGSEAEYKLAIIEADTMLDDVLKRMGHTEETLEEKLKSLKTSELENMEELKEARKVRNSVVHDPDYELTLDKTKEILKIYEDTFKNLKVFA